MGEKERDGRFIRVVRNGSKRIERVWVFEVIYRSIGREMGLEVEERERLKE